MTDNAYWRASLFVPEHMAEDVSALIAAECSLGVAIEDKDTVVPGEKGRTDGMARVTFTSDRAPDYWRLDVQARLADMGVQMDGGVLTVEQQEGDDWAHAWKKYFRPLTLSSRCHVTPSWCESPVMLRGAVNLLLDPGMAFGTGQHETTRLCTAFIDELCRDHKPHRVLDVGCGTGILAMFAKGLGCEIVVGIDNDHQAVTASKENAGQNNLLIDWRLLDPMGDPNGFVALGKFDLIVANVLAEPLIMMSPLLLNAVGEGGHIVLSGILASQAEDVAKAYIGASQNRGRHLTERERRRDGDWVALHFVDYP